MTESRREAGDVEIWQLSTEGWCVWKKWERVIRIIPHATVVKINICKTGKMETMNSKLVERWFIIFQLTLAISVSDHLQSPVRWIKMNRSHFLCRHKFLVFSESVCCLIRKINLDKFSLRVQFLRPCIIVLRFRLLPHNTVHLLGNWDKKVEELYITEMISNIRTRLTVVFGHIVRCL